MVSDAAEGTAFRAELLMSEPGWDGPALNITAYDAIGASQAEEKVEAYILNADMEAGDEHLYVNMHVHFLETYPLVLPGISEVDTEDYEGGTLIAAFDFSLNVIWYEFVGANTVEGFYESNVTVRNNGNIFFNVLDDESFEETLIKAVEYTPQGAFVRELVQSGTIYSLKEDDAGNIYITGTCAQTPAVFNGTEVELVDDYNFYVVKYDAELNYVWSNDVQEITCSFPDLAVMKSGEVIMAVSMLPGTYFFDDIEVEVPGVHYVVARLDASGAFTMVRTIAEGVDDDGTTENNNKAFLVKNDEDRLFIGGNARGNVVWNNGEMTSHYKSRPFLAELDAGGLVQWVNVAEVVSVSSTGQRLAFADNGSLVFGGYGAGYLQLDDVSVDSDENYAWVTHLDLSGLPTDMPQQAGQEVRVYPNPAGSTVWVECPHAGKASVRLFDNTGQAIVQQQVHENNTTLDVSALSPGIYLLQIKSDKRVYNQKVLVRR